MSELVKTTEMATRSIAKFYSNSTTDYTEWDQLYNDWARNVACEISDEDDLAMIYAFCKQIAGMDKLKIAQMYKTVTG